MLTKRFLSLTLALSLLLVTMTIAPAQAARSAALAAATTWYVDHAATGGNTGGSWNDAFPRLESALDTAQPGDQIWVAAGVYTPTNTSDRTATFNLKAGVAIYGGFDPASGAGDWEAHSWESYPTVLSGDLDGNDITNPNGVLTSTASIQGDNAYTVLHSSGLTQTARLDGFYITGGRTDEGAGYYFGGGMFNSYSSLSLSNLVFSANQAYSGGGMLNEQSNPSLVNVTFVANQAIYYGGGLYNTGSSPSLVNVTFSANQAASDGGGLFNIYSSSPNLVNVIFSGNQAGESGGGVSNSYTCSPSLVNVVFTANRAADGGGLYNYTSSSSLVNVTFSGNQANSGGGILNIFGSNTTISNSLLWGNNASNGAQVYNDNSSITIGYSLVQGGCPSGATCESLIDADPLFVRPPSPGADSTWGTPDDDYGDLRLQFNSPAINAGNDTALSADLFDLDGDGNTSEPLPFDLAYQLRILGPHVDMGAYEILQWFLHLPVVIR